ncbi:MAG: hypothetical protein IJN39_01695, partial [Clostridia bacterium]|nr:hypothetical protein [Clostridia bacterium]
ILFRFRYKIPTAAPFRLPFFCLRQRSASKPKASALPTALHPEIFIFKGYNVSFTEQAASIFGFAASCGPRNFISLPL